jgi:hypothetical protein
VGSGDFQALWTDIAASLRLHGAPVIRHPANNPAEITGKKSNRAA